MASENIAGVKRGRAEWESSVCVDEETDEAGCRPAAVSQPSTRKPKVNTPPPLDVSHGAAAALGQAGVIGDALAGGVSAVSDASPGRGAGMAAAPVVSDRTTSVSRAEVPAGAAESNASVQMPALLVRVGGSTYAPVADDDGTLFKIDKIELLDKISKHKAFASMFTVAALSMYRVFIVTSHVPAEQSVPTAANEANVVELQGMDTLMEAKQRAGLFGPRVFLIVRPLTVPETVPTDSPFLRLLSSLPCVEDVYSTATSVAAAVLRDFGMSLDESLTHYCPAAAQVLLKPLPLDTAAHEQMKALLLEFMHPVDGSPTKRALHERVWDKLQEATMSPLQRKSMVFLTGVSGAGKTKAAFDIGDKYAFVVLARVYEGGQLTPPWDLLSVVMKKLVWQHGRRFERGCDSPASAAVDGHSAVAAILLLLSCQLEWALAVYKAALAERPGATATADGQRALRQAVLRAQRKAEGNNAVTALFAARLRSAVGGTDHVLHPSSEITITIDSVLVRISDLAKQLPCIPVVWCYDEVQVLLTDTSCGDFFKGTFDASVFPSFAPGVSASVSTAATARHSTEGSLSAAVTSVRTGGASVLTTGGSAAEDEVAVGTRPSLDALPDDINACAAALSRECQHSWFYGLLVAVRHLSHNFSWGHLLCGSSLRLTRELLQTHSPAQGVCDTIDADVRLDAATIRSWFEAHLTPAACAGLDDGLIAQLVGRPLFAAAFFSRLDAIMRTPPFLDDPAAIVATALQAVVERQTIKAKERVSELWAATFPTATGEQPQTLVAWLYYMQRMGWGTETNITPPRMSSEVMDAVQRGVLHLEGNATCINLADEPITAAAIVEVADAVEMRGTVRARVLRALARRVTSAFGDSCAKGVTAEEVLAWKLLCRADGRPSITLRDLFSPFADAEHLASLEVGTHTVTLRSGLHCGIALGDSEAPRCFLDLLAAPGGSERLLHHMLDNAAGADLAFLAQRPGEGNGARPRQRLVLVQVKNSAKATAAGMLRSLDLGSWYRDASRSRTTEASTEQPVPAETAVHAAFRQLMARHPDWTDPIRVLVSACPWSTSAHEAVAEINRRLPQQPVLLAQITAENLGVDIQQGDVGESQLQPPRNISAWWPTQIRHWPPGTAHPQATLPEPPEELA